MKKLLVFSFLLLSVKVALTQVPVHKEPRHHVVFANQKARILNVLISPGDTTLFHLHSTPSVFIMLSKTRTGSQLMGEGVSGAGTSTPGTISFEDLSAPHTRKHRVWNEDDSVYHVADVELFTRNVSFSSPPLNLPHTRLITDTGFVRTYKIELNKTDSVKIWSAKNSLLLLSITTARTGLLKNNKPVTGFAKAGDYIWLNAGETLSIFNPDNDLLSFALLELK